MTDLLHTPVEKPRQIASLDGLRALSVVLVMVLHTLQRFSLTHPVPLWAYVLGNGGFGVQVFFVISGYLITTLLLRERDKRGTISLRAFYVRRAFRILSPLYFYIAVVAVLGAFGRIEGTGWRALLVSVTLTNNYAHVAASWAFEHFWSLCIEEQFYLLWPGALVFCLLRWPGDHGRRIAARVTLLAIVAEPIMRVIYFRMPVEHFYSEFHLASDGLMFGALGALRQGTARLERVYARATRWPWMLPVLLFGIFGTLAMHYKNYWSFPVGFTLQSFVILMWLLWLTRHPLSAQGRFFNHPAVRWVGRLSYSLYLWQTFFLHVQSEHTFGGRTVFNTFPTNWLCVFAAAAFSYYVIEQPSLRVRDAVMRRLRWHEA